MLLKKRAHAPEKKTKTTPDSRSSLIHFDGVPAVEKKASEASEDEGIETLASLLSLKGSVAPTSPPARLLTNEEEERAYLQLLAHKRKQEEEDFLVAKRIQEELERTGVTNVAKESCRVVRFQDESPSPNPAPVRREHGVRTLNDATNYVSDIELAWRMSQEEAKRLAEEAKRKQEFDQAVALAILAEEQEARERRAKEKKEREERDRKLAEEIAEKLRLKEERARIEAEQSRQFNQVVRAIQDEVSRVEEEKRLLEEELETLRQERQHKEELEVVYPSYWHPRQYGEYQVYEVYPGSDEWNEVATQFHRAGQRLRVTNIQRVQNKHLYKMYSLCKEAMQKKNRSNPERWLFHGSRTNAYDTIKKEGFDARVANLNGAIGAGVYFSSDLTTSLGYSSNNKLLYCRVLVGHSGTGAPGMRRPPEKGGRWGAGERYDSVTRDNMFVVFDNYQAYPEYLVSFSRW